MKKKFLSLVVVSFFMSACSNESISKLNNIDLNSNKTSSISNEETFKSSEINGIKFQKADPNKPLENMNKSNGNTSGTPSVATSGGTNPSVAAPAMAPATDAAISERAGALSKSIGIARPFISSNPFEEYVMTDYEEGITQGFSGSYIDAYNKIVKPVIKEWATDVRLTSSSGTTDEKGNNKNITPIKDGMYDQFKWNFTFASNSKKEVYSFYIGEKDTYVSRQKWSLKDLSAESVKIDSTKAIEIYKEKVADKNYEPENANYYKSPNSELLYTIPKNGTWSFYLQQEKEGLIWSVNVYFQTEYEKTETAQPVTQDPAKPVFTKPTPFKTISYSGGSARIDAKTGKVLSMNRIIKYTSTSYPYPCPNGYCGGDVIPLAVQ
ncbi:MAG: hypothetical protein U0457_20695 [Candidatus Sericytochromatia bacterium]